MSVTLTSMLDYFQKSGTTLNSGLIAYWKLDETSGTNGNDEIGTNDLTFNNVSVNQTGKLGKAIDFVDGTGARYVQFTTSPTAGKSELTISMWVYKRSQDGVGAPYWHELYGGANNYWQFAIHQNSWITRDTSTGYSGVRNNDLVMPTVTENVWTHLVFVYSVSGGYKRIYMNYDGALSEITTSIDQLTTERDSGSALNLGWNVEETLYYDGLIDEVGVWNRALTASEIQDLYNSGTGKTYPFS